MYNIPLKYIKRCYNCQVFRTNNNITKIVIKFYIKFKIGHSDMFYDCWVAEQVKFGEHFVRSTYGGMTHSRQASRSHKGGAKKWVERSD